MSGYEEFDVEVPTTTSSHRVRDLIAFFIFGLLNNYGYVLMLSAAEHLMEGSNLNAGTVLLADILPTLIIKLTAPFFMHRISFRIRVVFLSLCGVASFHLAAWPENVWLKLLGVVFASISSGGGEITFLALTSYYHQNTVSTWSSGTGGAGVLGSLTYLAATSWLGLTPFQTLMGSSVLPIFILIVFFFLLTTKENEVVEVDHGDESIEAEQEELSTKERVQFIIPLLKYMIPLFVVYYAEYTINQGVASSLHFPDSPFNNHYVYYQFFYQGGVFISRSSVNVFPIRRLWILPILQVFNLVFLIFQALYGFIPSIWIVFAITFYEGLLGGATYCNAFWLVTKEVQAEYLEFALGVTSVSDTFGIALAGVTSNFLGPVLKKHAA